jgi:hypothetical protein
MSAKLERTVAFRQRGSRAATFDKTDYGQYLVNGSSPSLVVLRACAIDAIQEAALAGLTRVALTLGRAAEASGSVRGHCTRHRAAPVYSARSEQHA